MTGLRKTADEVGGMDFPVVTDLLDYWLEFPPEHLLLRGLAGYESKSTRRGRRASEMQDERYKTSTSPTESEKDARIAAEFITGARHLDCAPPHIQQAAERAKKGQHLNISPPEL